jgi:hypothetical protein
VEGVRAPRWLTHLFAQARRRVRQRPWLSLAIVVGLGFALGGGLSTRTGRALLAALGRLALKQALQKEAQ